MPTIPGDKPSKDVTITDCGELKGDEIKKSLHNTPDSTGDLFEEYPEDNEKSLSVPEIISIATQVKEYGNNAFKEGHLKLALEKYGKGLRYLNDDSASENPSKEEEDTINLLLFTLKSNSALLSNKLKKFKEASKYASDALAVTGISEKDHAKALYRRAIAEIGLKDEDAALKDLEEANKLAPGDASVIKQLATVKNSVIEKKRKENDAFRKFFS